MAQDAQSPAGLGEDGNWPPLLPARDPYVGDPVVRKRVLRWGEPLCHRRLQDFGADIGSAQVHLWAEQANRFPPRLHRYDRYGRRLDRVEFHPAYHQLMQLAIGHRLPALAWREAAGHLTHAGMIYLLTQVEPGVCCPLAMTYAAVPSLRQAPELARSWEPRLGSGDYDPRELPAERKGCLTMGMAMTEKQGGSDLRGTLTRAEPDGAGSYRLFGHKWFCSAPMSDGFLTLAQAPGGLSCFLLPRYAEAGVSNGIRLHRLKDKLGNHANASAEIEYQGARAWLVGAEGAGIRCIIDMVQHTRLDSAAAAAGLMRAALYHAVHHCRYRSAFGRALLRQPLMGQVLADLALESAAAAVLVLRAAHGLDAAPGDDREAALARILIPLAKLWINKRTPALVAEAMECLGGNGYVEESPMPALYREAPLNGIWEGSGNVICLDVLRIMQKSPASLDALFDELAAARGRDRVLDRLTRRLQRDRAAAADPLRLRRYCEGLALAAQTATLLDAVPPVLADAFCRTRLGAERSVLFGALPSDLPAADLIEIICPPAS